MTDAPKVSLVGAGPGDPGLITRRGLELIRSCEVVLYDRLVDPLLVDEAPPEAERVFVGKKPGGPSRPQAEIDALIVDRAREGRRVVRLKGGDPFVFGRGADEAQALAAAGITFEIVPGVSSAIAVPAYAGIPVTHSGTSSSFAVLTAHESAARPDSAERWADVVRGAGTVVLLMGVSGLEETMQRIVDAGRDPEEPAAVIERGTTAGQRTLVATIGTIARAARSADVEAPAITVVGNVVRLREALSWYESRPLFGRRVIVTRPRGRTTRLRQALEEVGADVVEMPLIASNPMEDTQELDQALLAAYGGWIAFASAYAVEIVIQRLSQTGIDLEGVRIAAVGPGTAARLREVGIEPDLVAQDASGEGLAAAMGTPSGKVLVPMSAGRTSRAALALQASGWDVESVDAYRTEPVEPGEAQRSIVESSTYDAIAFASRSSAQAFAAAFGASEKLGLDEGAEEGPKVVAIGPTTAGDLTRLGIRVDAVASEPTADGLVGAFLELLTVSD